MKSDQNASKQETGTKAYIVSKAWIKKYERYIVYDQFHNGYNESRIKLSDDHFAKYFPGPITNQDLLEDDTEHRNLFGTGKVDK